MKVPLLFVLALLMGAGLSADSMACTDVCNASCANVEPDDSMSACPLCPSGLQGIQDSCSVDENQTLQDCLDVCGCDTCT
jgi:hypothetical protein